MELKVWCDGIQRVVCGVSSSTTCQDVVFALAHATGQTGRFMLVEKWRGNERLLAPQEHPVQVLNKWGEYQSDVTFVMRRSEGHGQQQQNGQSPASKSATSSPSSNGIERVLSPQRSDLRKLAFSSASLKSPSKSQMKSPPSTNQTQMVNSSSEAASPQTSHNNHNHKSNVNEQHQQPSPSSLRGPIQSHSKNSSSNHQQPVSGVHQQPQPSQRPRHPPPYAEAINKSSMVNSGGPNSSSSPSAGAASHKSHRHHPDDEKSVNKRPSGELSASSPAQKQRTSTKEHQLNRDARRLIGQQLETMKNQEQDMIAIENEIVSVEKKIKNDEINLKKIIDEMEAASKKRVEQESMILVLEKEKLDDELRVLTSEAKKMEEETQAIKKKLSDCEGSIGACRQQINQLMESLERNELIAKEKREVEECERGLMEQMCVGIRDKASDTENQKGEIQSLTDRISHLDALLHDKRRQTDLLVSELREANLYGLSLQPMMMPIDEQRTNDSNNQNEQFGRHHRSGSTRRMVGSPRELENAVATNKNPQGVWV